MGACSRDVEEDASGSLIIRTDNNGWSSIGVAGANGLLLVDLTHGSDQFEYRITVTAAPLFGVLSGNIGMMAPPGSTWMVPATEWIWSSIGQGSSNTVPANHFYYVSSSSGGGLEELFGSLKDSFGSDTSW